MEASRFETLKPSRYVSFTIPVKSFKSPNHELYFHSNLLQITVVDSPFEEKSAITPISVAAMLVPKFRETDWIFCTHFGLLQLLLSSPNISRLILVGNPYDDNNLSVGTLYKRPEEMGRSQREELETSLYPLLAGLLPKDAHFYVPFLRFEDNVVSSVVIDKCIGGNVGEMIVEDVETDGCHSREFRRRLRFKRMPNSVQSEIRILPRVEDADLDIVKAEFSPYLEVLVTPYLGPMVAPLALLAARLQHGFQSGVRPRAFCLGVGGGALLSFLSMSLGFEVVGMEVDEAVLSVAERYFGLETGLGIQLCVGDGVEMLKNAACYDEKSEFCNSGANVVVGGLYCCRTNFGLFRSKFDVIMVDLDSSDPKAGITAPTLEFLEKDVLLAARSCLFEHGILVLNVIAQNKTFYDMVVHGLREVFEGLHELDVGNGENFVLVASKTSIDWDSGARDNVFMSKLKSVISEKFIDAIRKI
ncbi:hypothetical protein vseg_001630 [Gypsophila vaccaria]